MNSLFYSALAYIFLAWGVYTLILLLGVRSALKEKEDNEVYIKQIQSIVEEITLLIKNEEELNMNKEENTKVENELTLSDLLNQEPKEDDYDEIIDILTELAQKVYSEYKFLIAKSPNEKEQANFLQLVSNWAEEPETHKLVFSKAIDYNIDTPTLQKKFAEKVASGEVIDLGKDVVVITDDGTPQPPTGVSPINSGLEGGEIAFIISFIHKDNLDEWKKNNGLTSKEEHKAQVIEMNNKKRSMTK